MSSRKQRQRREFLRRAAAYSVLGSSMSAMGGKLGLISSALAQSSDYAHLTDYKSCLLYTSPSPRDKRQSRMPSSA